MAKFDKAIHGEEVIRRFQAGERVTAIGRDMGICYAKLAAYLRGNTDYELRGRNKLNDRHDEIVSDYQSGMTFRDMGLKYDAAPASIKKLLKRIGVALKEVVTYTCNDSVFQMPLTDEAKYWSGFIMSDGCVHKLDSRDANTVSVGLHSDDIGHLEKLKSFAGSNRSIYTYTLKTGKSKGLTTHSLFRVTSRKMASDLIALGVVERKTLVAEASQELAESVDFWRGMIDGDGSISFRRSQHGGGAQNVPVVTLSGASEKLMSQFASFAHHVVTDWEPVTHRQANNKSVQLILTSSKAYRLVQHMYGERRLSLDRKQTIADRILSEYIPRNSGEWSSGMTLDRLMALHSEHTKWKSVAEHLGVSIGSVMRTLRLLKAASQAVDGDQ